MSAAEIARRMRASRPEAGSAAPDTSGAVGSNSTAQRIADDMRGVQDDELDDELDDDELLPRLEGIDAAAGAGGHVVIETRPTARVLADQLRTRAS